MTLQPLADRLLTKRTAKAGKTKSGIYIPETASETMVTLKVLAVGPGRMLDDGKVVPVAAKVGDVVVVDVNCRQCDIELAGEKCHVIRETDVLGILAD